MLVARRLRRKSAEPPDADALDEAGDAEPDVARADGHLHHLRRAVRSGVSREAAWCGHEFGDGYACDEDETQMAEPITGRAMAVVVVMVAMAVALALYFKFILD